MVNLLPVTPIMAFIVMQGEDGSPQNNDMVYPSWTCPIEAGGVRSMLHRCSSLECTVAVALTA